MRPKHFLQIAVNFLAVAFLLTLLGAPFYFAKEASKPASIAGAKIGNSYIIVSQIDKFPNLRLSQEGNLYKVTYKKVSPSQAFTGVVLITNVTNKTQNYEIVRVSGEAAIFFGENLNDQSTKAAVPSGTSIPISLFSGDENQNQSVEFTITAG